MKATQVLRRFLLPAPFISFYYYRKFGCKISPRAEVELTPNITIGRGTEISSFVKIKSSTGPLTIGERVSIATGVFIACEEGGVSIGDDSMVGPNSVIVGVNYRYDRLDVPIHAQGTTSKGITIGNDVWIGANSSIMDGASIGDHTIIGPGSMVIGKLPAASIATGSPAKVIFKRR